MLRRPHNRSLPTVTRASVGAIAAVLAVLAVYVLRLDQTAGLMIDDAWYILLGKALAEGDGYRLISSATTEILPLYPPGFPAILSLVFLMSPAFPANVWLLKSVSIAAMMGVGALTYVYLHRQRHLPRDLAGCAAVAVTVTPAFVFLATSTVMSECVFTLSQLATVLAVHRAVEERDARTARNYTVLAGAMAAATLLIRSAAVGLVIAAVLWMIKERLWKRTAVFVGVVAVCVLPWAIHSRANTPTAEEKAAHGGAIVYNYLDQLSMRAVGSPSLGRITLRDVPKRIRTNLVDMFARVVGGIVAPALLRGASESGEEVMAIGGATDLSAASMGGARETMIISCVLSLIALIGFVRTAREGMTVAEVMVPIALSIIAVWPFWSFRFVLPLTPFLFLYFIKGLQTLAPGYARIALLCIIGLNLYDHTGYILQARDPARSSGLDWSSQAREVDAALDWMKSNFTGDGVLAATNPALVHLRTGRKSIACDHLTSESGTWKRRGVRYAAILYPTELPVHPGLDFKVLYRSPGNLWVLEIR